MAATDTNVTATSSTSRYDAEREQAWEDYKLALQRNGLSGLSLSSRDFVAGFEYGTRAGWKSAQEETYQPSIGEAWETLMQTFSEHHLGEHDWSSKDPYDCVACHVMVSVYTEAIKRDAS